MACWLKNNLYDFTTNVLNDDYEDQVNLINIDEP